MRSKLGIRDNMLRALPQRGPLSLQMLVLLDVLPAAQIPRLTAAAQYKPLNHCNYFNAQVASVSASTHRPAEGPLI